MPRFQVLSDAQWLLIAELLPRPTGKPGRKFSDARTMIEGIVYRYRTGIAWRDLPEVYGPWQTVWTWHRRLADDGTWDRIHAELIAAADAAGLIDWSSSVDSTIARARQHATNTTRLTGGPGSNYKNPGVEPPEHAVGRSRGGLSTKIQHLVDGHGRSQVTLLTPGQAGDSLMLLPSLNKLRVARASGRPRTQPEALRGDKAYSSQAIRAHLRSRGIKAVIPEPEDRKGHRRRRGSRGGRPVGLDAADYKNRKVIERSYCHLKQWRAIATRYDKHAVAYRAAIILLSFITRTKALSDTP